LAPAVASAVRLARVRGRLELQDDTPENVCERITARVQECIDKERDFWLRDDYQIAWLTVRWSFKGVPEWNCNSDHPYVAETFTVLQRHPDDVWPVIMENRKARLGKDYSDWYDASGMMKPDIPKKKPAIVIDEEAERATRERLAGVLMFPTTALQFAAMEREAKNGKPIEMQSATQIEARQSLRILPGKKPYIRSYGFRSLFSSARIWSSLDSRLSCAAVSQNVGNLDLR